MTVLVAYDESAPAVAAFHTALEQASLRDTSVTVLLLVAKPKAKQLPKSLKKLLKNLPDSAPAVIPVFESNKQNTADAILAQAQIASSELIVLGAKKRSTIGKFLMGSATQRVLLESEIPVVLVKASEA